jgi:hypothetical protein
MRAGHCGIGSPRDAAGTEMVFEIPGCYADPSRPRRPWCGGTGQGMGIRQRRHVEQVTVE